MNSSKRSTIWFSSVLALGLALSIPSHANTERTAAAGALGGVIGATVGQQLGGQTGALIGAGIGAGAGGAIASNDKEQRQAAAIGGILGGSAGYSVGNSTNTVYGGQIGAALGGAGGVALGSKIAEERAIDRAEAEKIRLDQQRRADRQRSGYRSVNSHQHIKHAKRNNHGQWVSQRARQQHEQHRNHR
ncbi:MAG: glycine zipper domain-containing protein [Moraxellaceae bacterium]